MARPATATGHVRPLPPFLLPPSAPARRHARVVDSIAVLRAERVVWRGWTFAAVPVSLSAVLVQGPAPHTSGCLQIAPLLPAFFRAFDATRCHYVEHLLPGHRRDLYDELEGAALLVRHRALPAELWTHILSFVYLPWLSALRQPRRVRFQ